MLEAGVLVFTPPTQAACAIELIKGLSFHLWMGMFFWKRCERGNLNFSRMKYFKKPILRCSCYLSFRIPHFSSRPIDLNIVQLVSVVQACYIIPYWLLQAFRLQQPPGHTPLREHVPKAESEVSTQISTLTGGYRFLLMLLPSTWVKFS